MSFNEPPAYGAPQQPNPYGGQPAPGPQGGPGYGYPQAQPNPYGGQPAGYGYPQQPGGWGAVPPPQSGGNKGKIIGFAIGGIALVAAIGVGISVLVGGSGAASYKLTTPDTVLSGSYTKDPEMTSEMGSTSTGSDSTISNGTSVKGAWKNGNDELVFGGAYGSVTDPSKAMDTLITSVFAGTTTTTETPSGLDGGATMKCGQKDFGLYQATFCVWADSSTVGMAMWTPTKEAVASSVTTSLSLTSPSVSDWAQTTANFRNNVRVQV
jgi:hypothetical protein